MSFAWFMTLIVLGTVLLLTATIGVGFYAQAKSCRQLESSTGRYTEWTLWNGCLVEVDGKLIPKENWRGEFDK